MVKLSFALAFRNIVRNGRRSVMAVLAIGFGITSLLLAAGFIEWNLRYGRESTIHSQLGHIRLFKPGYLESGQSDPFAFLFPLKPEQLALVKADLPVSTIAPRLFFSGLASHEEATISFIGEGVDPDLEGDLSGSITIVDGQAMSSGDPRGILLGQGLAANLGVKPGDTIVLVVNTAGGRINAVEGTVRGLFATITKAYDDSALRVPITIARQLLKVDGAHSYAVLLDRTEDTDAALATLEARFSGQPIEFVPWYKMADFYNKTAELFGKQVGVVRLIIAVIIMLSIANSLMMSVLERTGEIGTMMAVGTRRAEILSLFLAEGVLLGCFGGALGLLVGWLAALGISAIGIPMPAPPGMAFGYTAEILLTWPMALQGFFLAIATTLLASIYPAWKASRKVIVDALRHNR
ncbi:MAG: ABC transporter permease [Azonexus sp.]|jgi:putative ABC transport system permease protein|nr:ABC transporter permease [Azonexus sp.]